MTKPEDDDVELDLDLALDLELDEAVSGSDPAGGPGAAVPEVPRDGALTPLAAAAAASSATAAGDFATSATTSAAGRVAESAAPSATVASVEGQWVWQYAAAPPPASFGSVFFAGRAFGELYRFFAAALLVAVGCLLPWGASTAWVVERGVATLGYDGPPAGVHLPVGALAFAIALWLLFTSGYGIYTGRQKILPVFLMLLPAWATWSRVLAAWDQVSAVTELSMQARLARLFEVAGTGVLLAWIGSTLVAVQLVLVIGKVLKPQPRSGDAARGRPAKDKARTSESESSESAATGATAGAALAKDGRDGARSGKR